MGVASHILGVVTSVAMVTASNRVQIYIMQ